MLSEDNILKITFSDTETALLLNQQLSEIQLLSYMKLVGFDQQQDFQIFPRFWENSKFLAGWTSRCSDRMKSNKDREV